jgi:hypothetical protein
MTIMEKLSDRRYDYVYDELKHQAQYMTMLQLIHATRNFNLSNITNNRDLQRKIDNAVLRVRELVRSQHENICLLCEFLGIKCPPMENNNNIPPPVPPRGRRRNTGNNNVPPPPPYTKTNLSQNINQIPRNNGNLETAYDNLTRYISRHKNANMNNIKRSDEFKRFVSLLHSSNVDKNNPSVKRILNLARNMNTGAQFNMSVNRKAYSNAQEFNANANLNDQYENNKRSINSMINKFSTRANRNRIKSELRRSINENNRKKFYNLYDKMQEKQNEINRKKDYILKAYRHSYPRLNDNELKKQIHFDRVAQNMNQDPTEGQLKSISSFYSNHFNSKLYNTQLKELNKFIKQEYGNHKRGNIYWTLHKYKNPNRN